MSCSNFVQSLKSIAVSLAIIVSIFSQNATAGNERGDADRDMSRGIPMSSAPYWTTDRIDDNQTSWYFVEKASLVHLLRHEVARAATYPLEYGQERPDPKLAQDGHDIRSGDGLLFSRRNIVRKSESFGPDLVTIRQLTAYFPNGLENDAGRIEITGNRDTDPLIFWSVWGHDRYVCFAYPKSGTIDYNKLPMPSRFSSYSPLKGEPYVRTLAVDLNIRFPESPLGLPII